MSRQCPNCSSHSGMHVDIMKNWCFACNKGIYQRDLGKEILEGLKELKVSKNKLSLPSIDIENYLNMPSEALVYLDKYFKGLESPNCFWSNLYNRLCFPYYIKEKGSNSKNKMIGCWMRDIYGTNKVKTLYAGQDKNTYLWKLETTNKTTIRNIAIVEDVISAIKVSKYCDVICLGGTHWNKPQISECLKDYMNVLVFLDGDGAGKDAAKRFRKDFKLVAYNLKILRNKKDPKEYKSAELQEFLL